MGESTNWILFYKCDLLLKDFEITLAMPPIKTGGIAIKIQPKHKIMIHSLVLKFIWQELPLKYKFFFKLVILDITNEILLNCLV